MGVLAAVAFATPTNPTSDFIQTAAWLRDDMARPVHLTGTLRQDLGAGDEVVRGGIVLDVRGTRGFEIRVKPNEMGLLPGRLDVNGAYATFMGEATLTFRTPGATPIPGRIEAMLQSPDLEDGRCMRVTFEPREGSRFGGEPITVRARFESGSFRWGSRETSQP